MPLPLTTPLAPLTVRAVQPADALTWQRLREALWPGEDETHGEVTTAFFRGGSADPLEVLLAERADGRVIAFVELSVRTDIAGLLGQRVGYVEGLYVVPELRARGVALRLLHASRAWSRQRGCSHFASDRDDRVLVDRGFQLRQ